eukprot:COSAG01_NODE_5918_length_3955_cov_16.718102_2_plen_79_part_00
MRTAAPSATLSVTVWQQYTRTGGCGVRMSANTARAPYWVRSHARRHQAELRKKGCTRSTRMACASRTARRSAARSANL